MLPLPKITDPSFDPLKMLEEFKEWDLQNRIIIRNFGNSKTKSVLLVNKWLCEKYNADFLGEAVSVIKAKLDLKKILSDRRAKTSEINQLANDLVELWMMHFNIENNNVE